MRLKAQSSKLKSKEKTRVINTAMLAAVLTVLLHGLAFSVPAYLIYLGSKPSTVNSQPSTKSDTIFIDVSMLPAIRTSGDKSIIKENEGKKINAENRDTGLGGQAEKQGSTDTEKEMLTYQDIIKQKIQQARRYPADARQKGIEGAVEMAFTVMKQGALKNVQVTAASGFDALDSEAVATIKRASPFPEMPADYKGVEMTMNVKIIFNME